MPSVAVNPPKTPVTKGSSGLATATLPNVCKMPGPPAPFVPTPLPNFGQSGKQPSGYSTSVTVEGEPVAIRGASFGSSGDIASKGTGGGILSNNAEGPTKFLAPGSLNVQIEGKNVQYLGDQMLNNCGPGGSPPNSATMVGVVQPPAVTFRGDLDALAEKCNKDTNAKNNHCPGGPPLDACTALGTAKHKCCERAIKNYNKRTAGSPYRSEVPFSNGTPPKRLTGSADARARAAADKAFKAAKAGNASTKGVWAKAYFSGGGAAFKADVLVQDGNGGYSKAYDFKFNCKDAGTPGLMKDSQVKKYRAATGLTPVVIHHDGRLC